jgi:hypothetical protein
LQTHGASKHLVTIGARATELLPGLSLLVS